MKMNEFLCVLSPPFSFVLQYLLSNHQHFELHVKAFHIQPIKK